MEDPGASHVVESPRRFTHPKVAFAHIFFKVAAALVYMFCGWFSSNSFVINFVIVLLLLCMDFWLVKNVTGRILVGMRYWNEIDDNGESQWRFEARSDLNTVTVHDSRIFWWPLYATPTVWGLFALFALIRLQFSYLLLVIIAITLTVTNTVGYTKCNKSALL